MLAMLYLVLFSALALGFYATTTTSVQISRNERSAARALAAAESGLYFMRYQMGELAIPSSTTDANLLSTVAQKLSDRMAATSNIAPRTLSVSGGTISIPGGSNEWINLDSTGNQRFRATITQVGDMLVMQVAGMDSGGAGLSRKIQLKYQKASRASAIFNYGVASRGRVVTSGSSTITGATDPTKGSVLSTNSTDATPVVIGGKEVSGDISITNPNGNISYSGAKIGGTTNTALIAAEHIHKGVPEPTFPEVNTDTYAKWATTKYTNQAILDNLYIAPNTNPKFTGNTKIKGVLLIQAPNHVEFAGNTDIQGVIVVPNNVTTNTATNIIEFTGSVSASSISTLPASYGDERNLTGAFLLAPGFLTKMWGNFGTVGGSIISSQFAMGGSAEGTVKGSVIQLNDLPTSITGSADVIIASTGTSDYPSGVTFGLTFKPLPGSYYEVAP